MIRTLRGRLVERGDGYVVVDVGGVGFQVFTPDSSPSALPDDGGEVLLHTRLHVREDALSLFGFGTSEEARLFDLLLSVSGVGPKVALGIISACRPRRFLEMVVFEDVDGLGRLPGVGRKLSQRLVVELRDKLAPRKGPPLVADLAAAPVPEDPVEEAIEALATLGYGRAEAAAAIRQAREELGEGAGVSELLKAGLKRL
ncbi:MAG TPA: Holliday junction branch migration protein RuvA [Clostridiales bacterium]|nr:Holliday junction branch migration protein RuvA [Clostridiales bacterium]